MNIWKSNKVYTAFIFMGHVFWTENVEDRVKLLELNVLTCCLQITTADLHNLGLKMRKWRFRGPSSKISGHCPSFHYPLRPPGAHIFCLTNHEYFLTCWAKMSGEHCTLPTRIVHGNPPPTPLSCLTLSGARVVGFICDDLAKRCHFWFYDIK